MIVKSMILEPLKPSQQEEMWANKLSKKRSSMVFYASFGYKFNPRDGDILCWILKVLFFHLQQ